MFLCLLARRVTSAICPAPVSGARRYFLVIYGQRRLGISGRDADYGGVTYTASKNCAKLFLSVLCQISTNCENFWHKDGKADKLMCDTLIFYLT